MLEYLFFACFASVFLLCGYLLGKRRRKQTYAGSLVIDRSGDKDRWTFLLDEDLDSVEKENTIVLKIEIRD